jgi:hypothetical protein
MNAWSIPRSFSSAGAAAGCGPLLVAALLTFSIAAHQHAFLPTLVCALTTYAQDIPTSSVTLHKTSPVQRPIAISENARAAPARHATLSSLLYAPNAGSSAASGSTAKAAPVFMSARLDIPASEGLVTLSHSFAPSERLGTSSARPMATTCRTKSRF